jgi:hypothetical protein
VRRGTFAVLAGRKRRNICDFRRFDPVSPSRYTRICVKAVSGMCRTQVSGFGALVLASRRASRGAADRTGDCLSGSSSVVEHRLAKARVASSNLVSRSNPPGGGRSAAPKTTDWHGPAMHGKQTQGAVPKW